MQTVIFINLWNRACLLEFRILFASFAVLVVKTVSVHFFFFFVGPLKYMRPRIFIYTLNALRIRSAVDDDDDDDVVALAAVLVVASARVWMRRERNSCFLYNKKITKEWVLKSMRINMSKSKMFKFLSKSYFRSGWLEYWNKIYWRSWKGNLLLFSMR